MAVYTNDLRLKEIATGDESGTWGDSTNTNLGLIADAFGFVADLVKACHTGRSNTKIQRVFTNVDTYINTFHNFVMLCR